MSLTNGVQQFLTKNLLLARQSLLGKKENTQVDKATTFTATDNEQEKQISNLLSCGMAWQGRQEGDTNGAILATPLRKGHLG